MKRDMDLVREILLAIEKHPEPTVWGYLEIEGFELGPINAHLHLLDEAGYIRAAAAQDANTPYGYMMQDASLTWAGYEFLETIRDTEIWRLTKTGAEKVGSWGISMLKSEEHTSELQSLMRISYAVFCLKNTFTQVKIQFTKA